MRKLGEGLVTSVTKVKITRVVRDEKGSDSGLPKKELMVFRI